jgi:sulfur carrier protein
MRTQVNGVEQELATGTTLAELIEGRGVPPSGVAVAVNGDVVRRADWAHTTLRDGAVVEVLTAVQGG